MSTLLSTKTLARKMTVLVSHGTMIAFRKPSPHVLMLSEALLMLLQLCLRHNAL